MQHVVIEKVRWGKYGGGTYRQNKSHGVSKSSMDFKDIYIYCLFFFLSVKISPQASSSSAMFVLSELMFDLKEVCEISRLTSEFSWVESVDMWNVLFAVWLFGPTHCGAILKCCNVNTNGLMTRGYSPMRSPTQEWDMEIPTRQTLQACLGGQALQAAFL